MFFLFPFDLLPPDYFALTHSPAPGFLLRFVASHNFFFMDEAFRNVFFYTIGEH